MGVAHADISPRARRRAKTIGRIVDASLRIVTEDGFDSLTMSRLADELDYAAGALYRYFSSKDALLLAVQLEVLQRLAQEMQAWGETLDVEGESDEVASLARVLVHTQAYATLPVRRPAHAALLARWLGLPELLVETDIARERVPQLVGLFSAVPAAFAAAAASGALEAGDAMRRTIALWSAVQGAAQMRKLARFGVDALEPEPLVAELTRALFRGWGADPDVYARALELAAQVVPAGDVELS